VRRLLSLEETARRHQDDDDRCNTKICALEEKIIADERAHFDKVESLRNELRQSRDESSELMKKVLEADEVLRDSNILSKKTEMEFMRKLSDEVEVRFSKMKR
jgi:rubrerythrin